MHFIIYDLQKDIRFQYNTLIDVSSKIRFYFGLLLICTKQEDKGNRSKHENLLPLLKH